MVRRLENTIRHHVSFESSCLREVGLFSAIRKEMGFRWKLFLYRPGSVFQ